VEEGALSQPTALERRKMPESDLQKQVRLGCQAQTTQADCVLRIPENKLKSVVQAALERQRAEEEEEW
jgi:2Fe-2S ferredoxin